MEKKMRNAARHCLWLAVTAAAFACLAGCGQKQSTPPGAGQPATKQYAVRGKVVSVDVKDGVIALDTEAIPGYMEAMTMAYTLENPAIAPGLHPGDRVSAHLSINQQGAAILSDVVVVQQAVLNRLPPVAYHVPQAGEAVPDFTLRNQSGKEIHLRQFRGKVLVLTFIYTRCQSSRFCPLMSHNFATLNTMLAADPRIYSRTHLLSISFDPKYDTPAVLRSYGGAYTGRYTKEKFLHWDFAAPSQAELASLLRWFDVGVTSSKDGTVLQHSVSTAVIGPDGTVRFWYPTNTWTPQQVFQDVQRVLAANRENGAAKNTGQDGTTTKEKQ